MLYSILKHTLSIIYTQEYYKFPNWILDKRVKKQEIGKLPPPTFYAPIYYTVTIVFMLRSELFHSWKMKLIVNENFFIVQF